MKRDGLTAKRYVSKISTYLRGCLSAMGPVVMSLLLSHGASAQQTWFWQNPLPQGNTLLSVRQINSTTIVSVGDAGTILRSTDRGATWRNQLSGVTNILVGLSFGDANNGTAVGFRGTVLRTSNGGVSWIRQPVDTTKDFYGVSFPTANTGTIVGTLGTILHTTNGGATWTAQTSGTTSVLIGVSFSDANTGTAVGSSGTIVRTTDGGATWTAQVSGTTSQLSGVYLVDANTGTIVGSGGIILRTANGGATWTPQVSGSSAFLWGVTFTDANKGTATGSTGTILRTVNGGTTWTSQTSGVTNQLYGNCFLGSDTAMTVGVYGTMVATSDGGGTWRSLASGTTNTLESVFFSNASVGTAVGDVGTILRTTNGGSLWSSQGSGTTNTLFGVSFSDVNTGTAVGDAGTIRRTLNGGNTWTTQTSGTVQALRAVAFVDANTGTTVGTAGVILRTTNGGIVWNAQVSGTANELRGVAFADANKGIAVGATGTIQFTGNGGTSWSAGTSGTTSFLYAVAFVDANTAIAVGDSGVILKSANAGATWTPQASGTTRTLSGVAFSSSSLGTAVGVGGIILRTADGGATWTSELSPVANSFFTTSFFSVCATQLKKRVAVGQGGIILSTGSLPDSVSVATVVSFPPSPGASTDYRLFSVPGISHAVSVSTLLSGVQNTDWKMFGDNGAATGYLYPLSGDSTLTTGQGYWLVKKGNVSFSRTVAVPPLSSGDVYPIPLHTGWNIIANPFDRPVAWIDVGVANNRLDTVAAAIINGYEGSYSSSPTLTPFKGYYFFNDNRFGLTSLRIPYPFTSGSAKKTASTSGGWQLRLAYQSDINIDQENYVGIVPAASNGLDMMDARKPPLFMDQGFLYFPHPEWDSEYPRFSSDFRPVLGDGQVWTFEVSNPRKSDGSIQITGMDQLPSDCRAVLINTDNSVPVDLRTAGTYRFRPTRTTMTFKLIVGKDGFVNDRVAETVPKTFALQQNYPNPFNPTTTIGFSLPQERQVDISLFNILGEKVATVVNDRMIAGYYSFQVDASSLASGIYFYRITAGDFVDTKRMLLVK